MKKIHLIGKYVCLNNQTSIVLHFQILLYMKQLSQGFNLFGSTMHISKRNYQVLLFFLTISVPAKHCTFFL